jgi:hypothetical protein
MVTIQPIHHDGEVVAFAVDGCAVISGGLADDAFDVVRAKCLYALEIATGERPGPYTDGAATAYARSAMERRPHHGTPGACEETTAPRRGPGEDGPGRRSPPLYD